MAGHSVGCISLLIHCTGRADQVSAVDACHSVRTLSTTYFTITAKICHVTPPEWARIHSFVATGLYARSVPKPMVPYIALWKDFRKSLNGKIILRYPQVVFAQGRFGLLCFFDHKL